MKKIFQELFKLYRFIFARPSLYRFNYVLLHLGLRGLGILNYEDAKVSGEDNLINNILPQLIKNPEPVLIDVGANLGKYSLALSKRFPKARIFSFEPHPVTYSEFCSVASNRNIKLFNTALGEKNVPLTLYDRADLNASSHASIYKEVISEIHNQDVVKWKILCERLDDFVEGEGIQHIDFLKIDTEGSEFAVLQGASRLLKENRIDNIHFEFNEMNVVSRIFLRDFRKLLNNFVFYRILPKGLLKLNENPLLNELFAYQNILAVKKNE